MLALLLNTPVTLAFLPYPKLNALSEDPAPSHEKIVAGSHCAFGHLSS